MERKFYNEELEQLIKEKADQYKMYPSERVWKGVYKSLHSSRRWYWFSFILFLAGISYYAFYEVTSVPAKKVITQSANISPENNKNSKQEAIVVPFTTLPSANIHSRSSKTQDGVVPGISGNSINRSLIAGQPQYETNKVLPAETISPISHLEQRDAIISVPSSVSNHFNSALPVQLREQPLPTQSGKILDTELKDQNKEGDSKRINWLEEYAVFELTPPKLKRLSWQLSFSPTMNYRKLTGNRNARIPSDVKNIPIALSIQGDLDHLVNHKPAIGFEMGTHVLYAINKNLSIKGGIQFNYSRYEIQAYSSGSSEKATIALNDFSGVDNDSLTSYTSLRNFGGEQVKDLNNQYFQVSAPIGAEFVIIGNKKIQFAVAATLQPTYLINRNTYLITTDYKNYTREPSLVRRWNVNTSAEAFISYKAVGVKWQIGPQFRYQLLSSYTNKYPIKEYLMEYGIKVGVSKTIR